MTDKELINKVIDKLVFTGLYTEEQGKLIKRQNLQNSPTSFLFSHDIAKALWGEQIIDVPKLYYFESNEQTIGGEYLTYQLKSWQYHLQQMVLEEDHLNYLRKTQEVWDV